MMLQNNIKEHTHDGVESQQIDILNLFGMIETVSSVPTGEPTDIYGQFKIYKNATTYRFYWYDNANAAWRYATGA